MTQFTQRAIIATAISFSVTMGASAAISSCTPQEAKSAIDVANGVLTGVQTLCVLRNVILPDVHQIADFCQIEAKYEPLVQDVIDQTAKAAPHASRLARKIPDAGTQ